MRKGQGCRHKFVRCRDLIGRPPKTCKCPFRFKGCVGGSLDDVFCKKCGERKGVSK